MKAQLYPRLAVRGIKNNKRVFVPFILTCAGMVMMFYIIVYLAVSPALDGIIGAETLKQMFALGSWVIAVFSAVFLFYTHVFLIRRRKKEFGLYNILGMDKHNIAKVLLWETLFTAIVSVSAGLAAGIALSKFAELGMVNIMRGKVSFSFIVSPLAILRCVQIFGIIFVLLYLNSVRQIRFSSAITLLRSESAGEKPPKGNFFAGTLGLLLLTAAYIIAVKIKDPVSALAMFFVAVLMVIVGTYLVFISGSVFFCRLLKKNKSYYYKPNHFVSVSSMSYRMKRNGAGLASISILATMVLVIVSSTTCMYFGEESAVNARYPREINVYFNYDSPNSIPDLDTINNCLSENGIPAENTVYYRNASFYGIVRGSTVDLRTDRASASEASSSMRLFNIVSVDDINRALGTGETLAADEALVYTDECSLDVEELSIPQVGTFRIKKQLDRFIEGISGTLPTIILVVPDFTATVDAISHSFDFDEDFMFLIRLNYGFDTGRGVDGQTSLYRKMFLLVQEENVKESFGRYNGYSVSAREVEREDFYAVFGTLFYLGIILSIVFVLAAVLIIYYKQISEGYEDERRFEIMQKVGMTEREIRKSINSQLLTVFFLPLAFAVMHVSFAFPMIRKLLLLLSLNNSSLFAVTTGISAVAFAVFYAVVYKLTSSVYFKIVRGASQ